ncbi:uncharacterized [Tachysurus ichikawai]
MSNFPTEGWEKRQGRTLPTCHQSRRTPQRPPKGERTAIDRCYPEPNGTKKSQQRGQKHGNPSTSGKATAPLIAPVRLRNTKSSWLEAPSLHRLYTRNQLPSAFR